MLIPIGIIPLTCGVIWNWVADIFTFIIIYNNSLFILRWYSIVFLHSEVLLWTLKMIENTLAMERAKICLHYGTELWIRVWSLTLKENTPLSDHHDSRRFIQIHDSWHHKFHIADSFTWWQLKFFFHFGLPWLGCSLLKWVNPSLF